jgi:hypothetical protein
VRSDVDKFDFSLAYYDPVLKMPFISFKPKDNNLADSRVGTSKTTATVVSNSGR